MASLLLLAYIGMFTAFSIRIFEAVYRQHDPHIDDISASDGVKWYQRVLHIDLPLHARAFTTSIIIVFVLILGELNATVLLIPPGKATLAVTIDNLLHYGANVQASVLCLVEGLMAVILVAFVFTIGSDSKSER